MKRIINVSLKLKVYKLNVQRLKFMKNSKITSLEFKVGQNLRVSLSRKSSGFAVIPTVVCT